MTKLTSNKSNCIKCSNHLSKLFDLFTIRWYVYEEARNILASSQSAIAAQDLAVESCNKDVLPALSDVVSQIWCLLCVSVEAAVGLSLAEAVLDGGESAARPSVAAARVPPAGPQVVLGTQVPHGTFCAASCYHYTVIFLVTVAPLPGLASVRCW